MTPEDRDKLIHGMRMLAQGRVNFVETVVDLLVPPQLQTEEVLTMSVDELIAKLDKQEPTDSQFMAQNAQFDGVVDLIVAGADKDPLVVAADPLPGIAGMSDGGTVDIEIPDEPTERGAPESPPEPKTVGSGSLKAKPGPKPKQKP